MGVRVPPTAPELSLLGPAFQAYQILDLSLETQFGTPKVALVMRLKHVDELSDGRMQFRRRNPEAVIEVLGEPRM